MGEEIWEWEGEEVMEIVEKAKTQEIGNKIFNFSTWNQKQTNNKIFPLKI